MPRSSARLILLAWLALTACASARPTEAPAPQPEPGFAALIERLSEPGGFFPSDNLVSNETSYQHVLGKMEAMGVRGGVYVGVGPDQNFSYIAEVRPAIAFLIDIRRDNLLQHLLYKAVFERARNRVEYLSLLTGRPAPPDLERWDGAAIEAIIGHIEATEPDSAYFEKVSAALENAILSWQVPVTMADLRVVRRIHEAFRRYGLDIRYAQVSRYPTWRELILQTDLDGRRRNYLATDSAFRYVQSMERAHRIVPVTGDLSGSHALAAIGEEVRARELSITTLYVSNVEQYLMRGGTFDAWATTVSGLPMAENGVIIRSYFGRGFGYQLPQTVYGHYSTQLLERATDFVAEFARGGYRSYFDLITKHALPLKEEAGSDAA